MTGEERNAQRKDCCSVIVSIANGGIAGEWEGEVNGAAVLGSRGQGQQSGQKKLKL